MTLIPITNTMQEAAELIFTGLGPTVGDFASLSLNGSYDTPPDANSAELQFEVSSSGGASVTLDTFASGGPNTVQANFGTSTGTPLTVADMAGTPSLGFFGAGPIAQAAAITPPSGGAIIDTQARTAIGAILTVLGKTSGFGLTA